MRTWIKWRRLTLILLALLLVLACAACIRAEKIPIFDPYGVFEKKVSEIPIANWITVPAILLDMLTCISESWIARLTRFIISLMLLIYTTVLIRILTANQVIGGISWTQYRYTGFGWCCLLLSSAVFISAAFSLREGERGKTGNPKKTRI